MKITDLILKEILVNTGLAKDKNGVFISEEERLKDETIIYWDEIVKSKVVQFSMRIRDLKRILEANTNVLRSLQHGWYDDTYELNTPNKKMR